MSFLKKLYFVVCLLSVCILGYAQEDTFIQGQEQPTPCLDRTFSIKFHFVSDSTGQSFVEAEAQETVAGLITDINMIFEPGCMSFQACGINEIKNWQFDTLNTNEGFVELLDQFKDPNHINVFMVSTSDLDWDPCGFSPVRGIALDSGAIVMHKDASCGAPNLAHFIGHYFGLLDTYYSENGQEQFVRENCEILGDSLCDTPADNFDESNPDDFVDVDLGCRFINSEQDNNGQYFDPDVGNIMSGYQNDCRLRFTNGQYGRMRTIYLNTNPKPW